MSSWTAAAAQEVQQTCGRVFDARLFQLCYWCNSETSWRCAETVQRNAALRPSRKVAMSLKRLRSTIVLLVQGFCFVARDQIGRRHNGAAEPRLDVAALKMKI